MLPSTDLYYYVDPVTSVRHGQELMWNASGFSNDSVALNVVVGGTRLQGITDDNRLVEIIGDTTTAWHRGKSATVYSGHRSINAITADGTTRDIEIPIRDAASVSCIQELDVATLVVGLRGYTVSGRDLTDTVLGGILYSTDAGGTWLEPTSDVDDLSHALVTDIQQRATDGSLWASVTFAEIVPPDSSIPGSANQGRYLLLRSDDNGRNWHTILEQRYGGPWVNTSHNIVLEGGSRVAWSTHDRVHYSSDDGNSFTLVDGLYGLTLVVSSIASDGSGGLLISTSDGLYRMPNFNVSVDENEGQGSAHRTDHDTPLQISTFPNPSTGLVTIEVRSIHGRAGVVNLTVLDLRGSVVSHLSSHTTRPIESASADGSATFIVDMTGYASGFYSLVASDESGTATTTIAITR